jgi:hypothetical protein
VRRLTTAQGADVAPRRVFLRGAIVGAATVIAAVGIVAAGAPSRQAALAASTVGVPEVAVEIDPASLPVVTEDADVAALNTDIGTQEMAVVLAENLKIEGKAMFDRDSSLLPAAAGGDRLIEMLDRVDDAVATGEVVVPEYTFDSLHAYVATARGGQGASLGFEATGVVEEVTYSGLGVVLARATSQFETTFVLSQVAGDRWLILEEIPPS